SCGTPSSMRRSIAGWRYLRSELLPMITPINGRESGDVTFSHCQSCHSASLRRLAVGGNIDRRGLLLRIRAAARMMEDPAAPMQPGRSHFSLEVCMKSYFVRLVGCGDVRGTLVGVIPML